MHPICQACLRIGDNVSLMSVAEVQAYRDIICKAGCQLPQYLHMCVFCRCLFRKIVRFTSQCRFSQQILNNIQDKQDAILISTSTYDLRCTSVTHVDVTEDNGGEERGGQIVLEGDGDRGYSDDEDDVPLVMLKTAQRVEEQPQKEQDRARRKERKRHKKKQKEQKPLREGFSSRMVQETAEYLVIKLNKEQVLSELAARAATERYRLAPHKCERCAKGFNYQDVLDAHMEKHSPKHGDLQCELCGQYCRGAVSLRGHMKSHTTRYQCKVCGLVRLSRQHVLEHHALAHAAAAAAPHYSCQLCRFTTHKRTVIQHHVRTHSVREPHACHRCGKLYKNLETLRIHITRHEWSGRVRCARCPLSFVSAAQLSRHARAVHERRDYYCVECDRLFNSMDTLKLHFQKAKRHRDTSSYKHECGSCGRRLATRGSLATHAARGCDSCGSDARKTDVTIQEGSVSATPEL